MITTEERKELMLALLWAVEDDLLDYELETGKDTSYERYLVIDLSEQIGEAL